MPEVLVHLATLWQEKARRRVPPLRAREKGGS